MKKFALIVAISCLLIATLIVGLKLFQGQGLGYIIWVALLFISGIFLFCILSFFAAETRYRQIVVGMWIALFSTVLSYAIADFSLGYVLISPISPPSVPDAIVHHRFVPNTVTLVKSPVEPVSAIVRVNNFGLRGKNLKTDKDSGAYRILLLGDSFTLGAAVKEEETFAVRLQQLFNRQGGQKIEVINAGINSYSPVLSYLQLKHHLLPLKPDLVVLNLDMSDLIQEQAYRLIGSRSADGRIIAVSGIDSAGKISSVRKVERWIANHLYLSRLVYYWMKRILSTTSTRTFTIQDQVVSADPSLLEHTLAEDTFNREKQWDALFESIQWIQELGSLNDFKFLLTTYPWGHQIGPHEWSKGRALFLTPPFTVSRKSLETIRNRSRNAEIHFFSLFPALEQHQGEQRLYFDSDMHWTPKGHEIVARSLFQEISATHLQEKRLIEP